MSMIFLFFGIGFFTSLISGVFGLLGGMILMVILLSMMTVPAAMLLSAMSQLLSNTGRCWLWRKHIVWRVLPPYMIGMMCALIIISSIAFIPSKALAFLLMGLLPLISFAVRPWVRLSILNRYHAFTGGLLLTAVQLTSGVVGPLLDLLYTGAALTRQQIISTKAFTQSGMHLMRLFYYGTLTALITRDFDWPDDLPWPIVIACLMGIICGTLTSTQIVKRMSDAIFKKMLNGMIIVVSLYCLFKAAQLWWGM